MQSLADATPQIALGALDGRYRPAVSPLIDHLSEPALNRMRVHVEVEWLIHLTTQQVVPGVRVLTADDRMIGMLRFNVEAELPARKGEADQAAQKDQTSTREADPGGADQQEAVREKAVKEEPVKENPGRQEPATPASR